MASLHRMADANANRAAEALRTLEDLDRFVIGGGGSAAELRALRHELARVVEAIEPLARLSFRSAGDDPGSPEARAAEERASGAPWAPDPNGARRPSGGAAPATRRDAADIAAAACSRLGEALRSLEECLRVMAPDSASSIERLRFRGYDAAAKVRLALGARRARQWRLCLLLTESLCRRPWREVLRGALSAGVDCVQVREKSMDDAALLARATEIVSLARPFGAAVIVNDRPDIALAAGADGVHLGQRDLPVGAVRRLGGPLVVGVSTHDAAEAAAAVAAGADCCGVGAMFPSALKPEREPSGVAFLRDFVERHPEMPHLAIGGITLERIPELRDAGCRGIAVSSAICGAPDPGAVAAGMLEAIGGTSLRAGDPRECPA